MKDKRQRKRENLYLPHHHHHHFYASRAITMGCCCPGLGGWMGSSPLSYSSLDVCSSAHPEYALLTSKGLLDPIRLTLRVGHHSFFVPWTRPSLRRHILGHSPGHHLDLPNLDMFSSIQAQLCYSLLRNLFLSPLPSTIIFLSLNFSFSPFNNFSAYTPQIIFGIF